jgi:coenzyme F420 hydrogenase subunit beta
VTGIDEGFDTLKSHVIEPGLCTRCGTCVGACPTGVLEIDQEELWPRVAVDKICTLCGFCVRCCPQLGMPFDDIGERLFGERPAPQELKGVLRGAWVGKSADPEIRAAGAAGGLGTALAVGLLESGRVNGVFQCGQSSEQPWKAVARLSRTRQEIVANAGSHYSTVPINALLKDLKPRGEERFALIGTGCHIQGLRKLQQAGAKGRRVVFTIGILCGMNISPRAALQLMEEMGIDDPDQVVSFTHRWPGGGGAEAILRDGQRRRVGRNFGHNMWRMILYHMTGGCAMCVDHYAVLADITVGDYQKGETVVFARSEQAVELIQEGIQKGSLDLRPIEWARDAVRRDADAFIFRLKLRRACTLMAEREARGLPIPDFDSRRQPPQELWGSRWDQRLFLLVHRVMGTSWGPYLARRLPVVWEYWLGTLYGGREPGQPWLLAGSEPIQRRIE